MSTRTSTLPKVVILLLGLCGMVPIPWLNGVTVAQSVALYTPYTKISVPPGESIGYSVDVINNGGGDLVFILKSVTYNTGLPHWIFEPPRPVGL